MRGAPYQAKTDPAGGGLFNGDAGGPVECDLAECPVGIQDRGGGQVGDDLHVGGRIVDAVFDAGEVARDAEDAMGIDAAQIRPDQHLRDQGRILRRYTAGGEQFSHKGGQRLGRYDPEFIFHTRRLINRTLSGPVRRAGV